jgi:hypothetical protein
MVKKSLDVGLALRYAMGELEIAYQEYRHFGVLGPGIREGCRALRSLGFGVARIEPFTRTSLPKD